MLDLAETLDPLLNERHDRLENGEEDDEDVAETTLQLVFFDGEEAFKDWTATDSIYGARYVLLTALACSCIDRHRHLAQKWSTSYIQPNAKRRLLPSAETELGTIEHLILLDLLGAKQPQIKSSFVDTAWLFDAIASVEKRLADRGVFVYEKDGAKMDDKFTPYFIPRNVPQFHGGIEDDHIPFLKLGVSVLHVISSPFPHGWHTLGVRFSFVAVTVLDAHRSCVGQRGQSRCSHYAKMESHPTRIHGGVSQSKALGVAPFRG